MTFRPPPLSRRPQERLQLPPLRARIAVSQVHQAIGGGRIELQITQEVFATLSLAAHAVHDRTDGARQTRGQPARQFAEIL